MSGSVVRLGGSNAFSSVIKKELLESILSFKFTIIFPAIFVLLILSFLMGINEYKVQLREHSNLEQLNRDQLQRSSDWHQLAGNGLFVARRPSPLTVFATGVFGTMGQVAKVTNRDVPVIEKGHLANNPAFILLGNWDFNFIVKVVLSLFALLFAYDAVSGEKESGTLKLLLSNSIARNRLLLGKAFGRFLSLALAFLLAFLISVILLSMERSINLTSGDWLRILFISLGSLLYLAVFFAIGLMTSCLTNQAIVSLLPSLFIWVLLLFGIPKASGSTAAFFYQAPTAAEFEAKKVALAKDMYAKYTRLLIEPMRRWFRRPENATLDELHRRQKEFEKVSAQIRRENEAEHMEKLYRLYEEHLSRHKTLARIASNLSRLSPASCYDYFITELTETGPTAMEAFAQQLLEYQNKFSSFVSEMMASQEVRYVVFDSEDPFVATRPDLKKIPGFEYRSLSLRERLANAFVDVALLFAYLILTFSVGLVSFLKYDPR